MGKERLAAQAAVLSCPHTSACQAQMEQEEDEAVEEDAKRAKKNKRKAKAGLAQGSYMAANMSLRARGTKRAGLPDLDLQEWPAASCATGRMFAAFRVELSSLCAHG